MKFAFIHVEKATYPVHTLCSVLQVSRSGYYDWATRPTSTRTKADSISRLISSRRTSAAEVSTAALGSIAICARTG